MTQHHHEFSDEILNAYLDDELQGHERKQLMETLQHDEELSTRLCKLKNISNMVQIAYHDKLPPQPEHKHRQSLPFKAVAAIVLLVIGAVAGWMGSYKYNGSKDLLAMAKQFEWNNPPQSYSQDDTWKVLLHVTSDDPYKLKILLDETERVLEEYANMQQKVAIEILANGKGLNLLRDDESIYGQRIQALQSKYKNLVFMACGKAIERLRIEKGINVKLLPDTRIAPSALSEVMYKKRQGWTYIKL